MKKVFLTIAILTTPITVHAACTQAPDCATLGYTKTATDCPNGGVKCPFDETKLFCQTTVKRKCAIGDIVYSDKSCDPARVSGKTPIGVVGFIDGNRKVAISLTYSNQTLSTTTSPLPDSSSSNLMKILIDYNGQIHQAATKDRRGNDAYQYCANYSTEGSALGDWYLPAIGELYASIVINRSLVEAGLSLAGGLPAGTHDYWSSSSSRSDYALRVTATGHVSDIALSINRSFTSSTRCAISF